MKVHRPTHLALRYLACLCAGLFVASCGTSMGDIVRVGGSSTLYPISEAVAEEFGGGNRVPVTIASSGTGGGFKQLCEGSLDVAGASRPIKSIEIEKCAEHGYGFIELPVAYDGIVVVVHPEAHWVDSMTVAELARLWAPEAQNTIMRWNQIRPEWPDEPIRLYGAGVDSGTYDYFTKAIVGTEHASRGDYTSSEDDNIIVQGIASDRYSLGFFGFAYYIENTDILKPIAINDEDETNGAGAILPTIETVQDGTYQPLARPLLVYVRSDSANKPGVAEFVNYYIENSRWLSEDVGYIGLPDRAAQLVHARFNNHVTGSLFTGGSRVGVTVEELLAEETP